MKKKYKFIKNSNKYNKQVNMNNNNNKIGRMN